jgi:DNA helicase IV
VKYSAVDINYGDELWAIAERIKALEGEQSRVAIICPNNNRFAELSYYLKSKGVKHNYYEINGDLRNHDFNSTTPLFISIFNAEGLQFDNVILFGFDESNYIIEMKRREDRLRIILYVGMTRARNTTYIIRSEDTVAELKGFNCLDH